MPEPKLVLHHHRPLLLGLVNRMTMPGLTTTPLNRRQPKLAQDVPRIFAANVRMTQLILEHLDPSAWNAKPPGKVRTIAAIATHMHNVRSKWIRLTAPHLKAPALLNRNSCTLEQAHIATAESGNLCVQLLTEASSPESPIKAFHRDGWAPAWPINPGGSTDMLCYMLAHEAHHRGQILMLAHQLGFPLPRTIADGIWHWERF